MSHEPSEPADSRRLKALSELLRVSAKRATLAELDDGLLALRSRVAVGESRRGPLPRWSLAFATALVGVALALGFTVLRQPAAVLPRPVVVQSIEGGKLLDGGYLSETGHSGIKLLFDEGSEFILSPGTRGRLRSVTAEGARMAIERGTAEFHITPDHRHRWSVEAGPFVATVKGTEFSVRWDPVSEQFELTLRNGRVSVSGPVVGEGLVLAPGQKLSVSVAKAESVITESRPEQAVDEAASAVVVGPAAALPAASAVRGGEPALSSASAAQASATPGGRGAPRRWQEALANGEWDRILAEVDRNGADATIEVLTSDELSALTDAARYRRRTDLARTALLAQRRRFPSSPRALDAAFLLGRVEESGKSGLARAISWYDEYLSRAPGGTYAAEALGRKMVLSSQVYGPTGARAVAEEYLRRFPGGSYAGAARALLRAP